jgi:hypothetical protein
MDRDGTIDDLCEGVFRVSSPPYSGTTGVAHEQRSSRPIAMNTYMFSALVAAGACCASWRLAMNYFFITSVHFLFTSMN